MQVTILNPSFVATHVMDTVASFIWTDRFCGAGDFEITADPTASSIEGVENGNYLLLPESEHMMIVESLNVYENMQDGVNVVTFKGRSLESILERRIVWNQTDLDCDFQDGISRLLTENLINPDDPLRDISNFDFVTSTDPAITDLWVKTQLYGETLYKAITELCISKNVGFKVVLSSANRFQFSLYAGADRSQRQFAYPYVVFSKKFNNLVLSNLTASIKFFKSVGLVAGEKGVGNARYTVTVECPTGAGVGVERRELYIDAGSVNRHTEDVDLTDEQYALLLSEKGWDELDLNRAFQTLDGQVDHNRHYIYGVDFFMGDLVQIEGGAGYPERSKVTELTFSQDQSGIKIFPTFVGVPD